MIKISEPIDTQEQLPFSKEFIDNLTQIDEGNIQTAYRTDTGILHIAPEGNNLTPEQQLVCERWIHPNKSIAILNSQTTAARLNSEPNLLIPNIDLIGSFPIQGRTFQYWHEEFLEGESLKTAMFNEASLNHYEMLIDWVANFHQETEKKISVKEYYQTRLKSIVTSLSDSELTKGPRQQFIERLLQKGVLMADNIDEYIDASEMLCLVHGDLRGGNVLINKDTVGVIDFEQGVFGGDWFIDIEKLLKTYDDQQPDITKPYLYRPPLNSEEKDYLIHKYIKNRTSQGWSTPSLLLNQERGQKRKELLKYDTFISTLILRDLMGWHFNIEGNKRGTEFILDSLEKRGW